MALDVNFPNAGTVWGPPSHHLFIKKELFLLKPPQLSHTLLSLTDESKPSDRIRFQPSQMKSITTQREREGKRKLSSRHADRWGAAELWKMIRDNNILQHN